MSFTAEVKDELSRVPATCSHCDKAVLAALVRIEGTLFVSGKNRYRVEIATDAPSVARLVIKLLHELYRLKTNLTAKNRILTEIYGKQPLDYDQVLTEYLGMPFEIAITKSTDVTKSQIIARLSSPATSATTVEQQQQLP